MYWEKDIETLPREKLEAVQLERLKNTLQRAAKSPHYGGVFREKGFDPTKLNSLQDVRNIPLTTKEDLRASWPYGLVAVSKDELVRMHSSSGTTGRATVIFHTMKDIQEWANLMARCMYMTGVRKGDVFQNMMTYGLFTGGLGFHYGAEKIGALVIPAGAGNSKRQIQLMRDFETTFIHIIPSYALHLYTVFEEVGLDPKKDTKLKLAFIGAEPHSEKTRKRIEEFYGVKAYNSYGLSEMNGPGVAFECPCQTGLHIWEDNFIVEIINPDTLEPLPDGEEGELVMTTLLREGMPILRYRTKDLTRIVPGVCECGRTHRRIDRIKGRTDDMLIIKGVNIFPIQVEKKLMEIPGVGTDYVIVLEREGFNDVMTVKVEVQKESFNGDLLHLEALQKKIVEALKSDILITPKVVLVAPGSLPKTEGKAVRVIDNRKE
ncbi:MAG TPA: phenylacetate--CoA ligase [Syntrophales bacterium]|jgi:phenylacetate-CoA ligase|nr:phenylacetate--CoA ligase [Syntrophales bacterium]HOX94324.1 phenylacetate--CoA ligase [Syntrophales bacterium]HPI56177.1 phenylacetate--CoA ligase [Syntrophales bacterium]HPN24365.1 phenylacetate--CoA ligase [Syntrophales bacterium]HQM28995.1 phenylacetate--CoA ligase [Syntrophales bacterium]